MTRILWLVTARSGSKGIPGKNIKLLGGIPLMVYRIKSALQIADKCDVWVSTDKEQYAEIAEQYGATIPFIRPDYLATDTANSSDVVLHAMGFANSKGLEYDAIGLLEPTSPFVKPVTLNAAAAKLFEEREAENIVSVREARPARVFIQKDARYLKELAENIKMLSSVSRQTLTREITPSGGLYISKWGAFLKNKTFYTSKTLAHEVSDIENLEIDEPIDFLWAEFLLDRTPDIFIKNGVSI